jgi:hypothetical protein
MVVGTPSYYSPEQARGLDVDGRSDLYAAAIVLYEMLTGELPIKGRTPIDFVRAHAVDAPTPAKAYGIILPGPVDHLIMRTLEKDPNKRYANAREMKAAVDAARATLSQLQIASMPAARAAGKAQRKKMMYAIGGALGLILVLVAVMLTTIGPDEEPRKKKGKKGPELVEVPLSPKIEVAGTVPLPPPPMPEAPKPPPAGAPAGEAVAAAAPPAEAHPAPEGTPPTETPAAPVDPANSIPPPMPMEKTGKLLLRGLGTDIQIQGVEGGDVNISGSGTLSLQAEGWQVQVKYRRTGNSVQLTVESKPTAMVSLDEENLGRVGTVRVGKGKPSKIVFRQPAGGELVLIAMYKP